MTHYVCRLMSLFDKFGIFQWKNDINRKNIIFWYGHKRFLDFNSSNKTLVSLWYMFHKMSPAWCSFFICLFVANCFTPSQFVCLFSQHLVDRLMWEKVLVFHAIKFLFLTLFKVGVPLLCDGLHLIDIAHATQNFSMRLYYQYKFYRGCHKWQNYGYWLR